MKWKIIIEKMIKGKEIVKEAIIDIKTADPSAVVDRIQKYGWRVTYLVPVSPILDDADTIIIETGRKP